MTPEERAHELWDYLPIRPGARALMLDVLIAAIRASEAAARKAALLEAAEAAGAQHDQLKDLGYVQAPAQWNRMARWLRARAEEEKP